MISITIRSLYLLHNTFTRVLLSGKPDLRTEEFFLDETGSIQFEFPCVINQWPMKGNAPISGQRHFATNEKRDKNRFRPENFPPSARYPADICHLGWVLSSELKTRNTDGGNSVNIRRISAIQMTFFAQISYTNPAYFIHLFTYMKLNIKLIFTF